MTVSGSFSASSIFNKIILPIGANAAGGALGALILSSPVGVRTATVSGMVSGVIQAAAAGMVSSGWNSLEGIESEAGRTAAKVAAVATSYTVHVGVLLGVNALRGRSVKLQDAAVLTAVGWGACIAILYGSSYMTPSA
jgi:hypothetical protein